MLLFTLIGIFTIGIQPQLQLQNIFAMIESNDLENETELYLQYGQDERSPSISSQSESQPKFIQINPFGFADDKSKETNENADIANIDAQISDKGTYQTSIPDSQSQISNEKSNRNYHDNSAKKQNIIETDDKPGTELSSIDKTNGTFGSNVSELTTSEKNLTAVQTDDIVETNGSQSQLDSQSSYNPNVDYGGNNSAREDSIIETDDMPGTESSSIYSADGGFDSNVSHLATERSHADKQLTAAQTDDKPESSSQPQLDSQPNQKSYSNYIDNSTES
jgi:hypothetical protein